MNRQNESSAEATTENIENKLDPNTPEILESKRGKNSKEHVSDSSRLDIEGYIFKDSKLIKKKKKEVKICLQIHVMLQQGQLDN